MKTALASILVLASAGLALRPKHSMSMTGRSIEYLATNESPQLAKRQTSSDPLQGNDTYPAVGYFKQPIDHNNPSLGTFNMRYYWSNEFWKGPGSPIVLFQAGEYNASTYLSYYGNYSETEFYTSPDQLAFDIGAAFLMIENRYYGESSPYAELTTANLQYLTFEQVMYDLVNFAENVKLPFDHNSTASTVPWVLVGGSYGGVITTYIADKLPGTFWAYYASSATLQEQEAYWRQSIGFQQGGPKNCSKDAALVVDYIDQLFSTGSEEEIVALKTSFGLQNLTHNEDFLLTLSYDPELWFDMQFDNHIPELLTNTFLWCDAIEGAWDPVTRTFTKTALPGIEGVGLQKALENWAKWVKYYTLPGSCASKFDYPGLYSENSTYCYESYDPKDPFYTDLTVDNPWNRQYLWLQCNEPYGFWTTGAPEGYPTVISRLLTVSNYYRWCKTLFPTGPKMETYGLRTQDEYNTYWGGWNIVNTTRLLYVNGENDYWRPATVAAEQRPGGPLKSTPQVPTWIIPGGYHCSDFFVYRNARINEDVRKVIDQVLVQLKTWVKEWPGYNKN
ncbi:hypothetical protein EJ02DRAFT_458410 [Clathrospora elynae]|uniref:Peptidase S28 n=1 Tax=Clathrospora elynae TaxID=706981 RepID=A0A6A5SB21_9PLEO|nr:hypothetical protein EJ02DRAFT_458410 [Clathrospora elynae]